MPSHRPGFPAEDLSLIDQGCSNLRRAESQNAFHTRDKSDPARLSGRSTKGTAGPLPAPASLTPPASEVHRTFPPTQCRLRVSVLSAMRSRRPPSFARIRGLRWLVMDFALSAGPASPVERRAGQVGEHGSARLAFGPKADSGRPCIRSLRVSRAALLRAPGRRPPGCRGDRRVSRPPGASPGRCGTRSTVAGSLRASCGRNLR